MAKCKTLLCKPRRPCPSNKRQVILECEVRSSGFEVRTYNLVFHPIVHLHAAILVELGSEQFKIH